MKIKKFLVIVKRKLRSRGVKMVFAGEEEADRIAKKIIDINCEELVAPVLNNGTADYLFFSEKSDTMKRKRRFR